MRVVLLVWLVWLCGTVGATADPPPRIGERLRARLEQSGPSDRIRIQVVLRKHDLPRVRAERRERIRARQDRVLGAAPAGSFELRRRYRNASGFAGWARPEAIRALERHPEVERVYLDGRLQAAMTEGAAQLGSDVLVAQGFTGQGVNVAVLDTGIDTDHQHLVDDLVAEQCFCDDETGVPGCCPGNVDEASGPGSAEDDEGHGTSMAGIITSKRAGREGIANGAGIVAVKVLADDGFGTFSDLDKGLDWVLDNYVALGIRVVNLSLSDGLQYNNGSAFPCTGGNTEDMITQLVNAGVTVFAAAGNNGHDNGISLPACVPAAIAVGGYYDTTLSTVQWCLNTPCTQSCSDSPATVGTFVCHSNSGSLLDVLAPNWTTRTLTIGGNANVGGTSVSSAYASAEAALLLSVDPTLTPTGIEGLLTTHSHPVTNPENSNTYPATDLDSAFAELLLTYDTDEDGIPDDGDGSLVFGDAPCVGGQTAGCDDNCVDDPNANQADPDGDAIGDVCDICPLDPLNDVDGDLDCGDVDNCPTIPNPAQQDADLDGAGNACDVCPLDPLDDIDSDGFCADVDNCPAIANPGQEDGDGDGIGDACDPRILAPALGGPSAALLAAGLLAGGVWAIGRRRPSTPPGSSSQP